MLTKQMEWISKSKNLCSPHIGGENENFSIHAAFNVFITEKKYFSHYTNVNLNFMKKYGTYIDSN